MTKDINVQLTSLNKALYAKLSESHPDAVAGIDPSIYERDSITIKDNGGREGAFFYSPFESAVLVHFHLCQLDRGAYYTIEEIFFYANRVMEGKYPLIKDLGVISLTFNSIRKYALEWYNELIEEKKKNMN